ncbi:2'-5'-oligoadenylate synthase 1A-like [Dendronephthya gigantea]|uniref:2'-5'-oligoadenylate synthase 1A-like n=1 Tax=Dendronephthya gigantea TaxID=151771 RepID=UPI00106B7798|nr:2'-5'-oligoadenylate synthase 1A-like [Dendronephthya gigantea]
MKPDEIIKGGSQGKRTAVKGMCDIDLVMVLNELEDAENLENELPRIRKDIRSKLTRYGGPTLKAKDSKSGLKFKVNGDHGPIKVDLLPTFGFTDLQTLYCEMRFDKSHSDFYRAALSKWQVDFVKKYPANVKNLIRLIKYWKKKMVRKSWYGQRIPNSYLMELITIYYWEENTRYSDGTFNTLKAFHGIMEALKDYQSLNIFWTENYSAKDIPSQILRQRPLVLDPANPTNNVCSGYHWEEIRQEAKNVLKSAMMEGVSSFSWK